MDAITREVFNKWAQKNNWMQVGEGSTSNGHQTNFLTPSGNMVVITYALKGNLYSVGQPVPAPQPGVPKNIQLPR